MTSRFGTGSPLDESAPYPALYLLPLDDSFYPPKRIALSLGTRVRIGRQLNQKTTPSENNGVFESRVLSRQHAEVWLEGDKFLIRDVKSSNGTFINGERLSAEGVESAPAELHSDDIVEFGIDIVGEQGEVVHRKVAARATCATTEADAQRALRAEQRVYPPAPTTVPPPPPSTNAMNVVVPNMSGNALASGSGAAQRRPQHATGLAGMGGMGSERIRPKSGDFDSILARLRDGPRAPPVPAAAPLSVHSPSSSSSPPRPSSASSPIPAGNMQHSAPSPSNVDTMSSTANLEPTAALEQLRAALAQTQATLASVVASPSLVPPSSAPPPHDSLDQAAHLPTSAQYGTSTDVAPPLIVNARALRSQLASLREDAGSLHRARAKAGARRRRAATVTLRRDMRRPDVPRDDDDEEDGNDTEVEDRPGVGSDDAEWEDDIDFHAEAAGVPMPLSSPTGRLHGVFRMVREIPEQEESVPPDSPLTHEYDGTKFERESVQTTMRDDVELEAARALSAQLDVLADQLELLHGRLRALQSEPVEEAERATDGAGSAALEGLGQRVEALEGELAAADDGLRPVTDSDPLCGADSEGSVGTAGALHADDGAEQKIKDALHSGLAALQDDWAAFRAEAAAYSRPMHFPWSTAGTDLPGWDAARRADAVVGSATAHVAQGKDLDDSSHLAAEAANQRVRVPSDDEVRVPGRWGLLTPAGSVRESVHALQLDESPRHVRLQQQQQQHTNGSARLSGTDAKSRLRAPSETEQTLLLAGAVGAAVALVAAAWWGA